VVWVRGQVASVAVKDAHGGCGVGKSGSNARSAPPISGGIDDLCMVVVIIGTVHMAPARIQGGRISRRGSAQIAPIDPHSIISEANDGRVDVESRVIPGVVEAGGTKGVTMQVRGPSALSNVLITCIYLT
jgi:hypothetical protein